MMVIDKRRAAYPKALSVKLGRRILFLCDERGWSRRQLAAQAKLDQSYVARIVRGVTEPGLGTLVLLADAFDMTPSEFLEGVTR
jgi:transcriptional regulator with XRE-family HTH domain